VARAECEVGSDLFDDPPPVESHRIERMRIVIPSFHQKSVAVADNFRCKAGLMKQAGALEFPLSNIP
jgi:hypothetical protein